MFTNISKIDFYTERYCFKCHKIKGIKEFTKQLYNFRHSDTCNECKHKLKIIKRYL